MVGVAKKARDLRTKRHIKVDDAAAVIAASSGGRTDRQQAPLPRSGLKT
jgi:hypothetical protein